MSLSDYDILGISSKSNFKTVKDAYYELVKIYHPDSKNLCNLISMKEKKVAITKINNAYENIKKKLNITETDLPQIDIKYNEFKINKILDLKSDKDFNQKFNEEFLKIHKLKSQNDPFSIYYKEPEDKNLYSSKLIETPKTHSNTFEFGINYIHDHSSDKYLDIRNKFDILSPDTESIKTKNKTKNKNKTLDQKYKELKSERKKEIKLNEKEKSFIHNQIKIEKDLQLKKDEIFKKQTLLLI